MEKLNILLVEDDADVAEFIIQGLEEEGYVVFHADRYSGVLKILEEQSVDLVILDILLPEMNGLEVCRSLREIGFKDLQILMLTALASPENVVIGLDSGADDYLSKPFKLIELKARVRSLIRRKREITQQAKTSEKKHHRYGFIEMDDYKKVAYSCGQPLNLTSTEYRLLLLMLKSPEKVFDRTELLDKVWGINFDIGSNVVDVYVNYLRKKIEKTTKEKAIHTVIGMGYVLKIEE
ncbi:response regulator transcription factor [Sphingobacterium shayense]|uniref:response regulator transcription factor n=1 Tax=Sphingobacterium shayense TaxID=626343 RepID=UPI001554C0A7|nr:response regulator transcription factor [Sphingobacterium shayense]NQD72071.1 response regulator transcription factor [Sphingobacterium shayense]